jgi:hypothetical protein
MLLRGYTHAQLYLELSRIVQKDNQPVRQCALAPTAPTTRWPGDRR